MTHKISRRRLLAYSGAATVGLAGCTGSDSTDRTTTSTPGMESTAQSETDSGTASESSVALSVSDQEVDDRTVTVSEATIDASGWLVIHPEAEGGGPNGGVVLARRTLSPGTVTDVELTLDATMSGTTTLYAMLHYDDPADGEFTFPGSGDPPVTRDGSPVVVPFDVTAGDGTARSEASTVTAVETSFDPTRLSISPGTTVRWVNEDSYGHDVTSTTFHDDAADWELAASLAGNGGTATYTFETAGIYEYYCSIHGESTMCGAVLVGDVSLDGDLPCEGDENGGGGY